MSEKVVGILAMQGDFAKHAASLKALGVPTQLVRTPEELLRCSGLIIPGGESTAIFRQLEFSKLIEPISHFAKTKPIFGTCAGLILMSREIAPEKFIRPFGLIDLTVERNAFGRQSESFSAECEITLPKSAPFMAPAFFIRAPRIRKWGENVAVLATFEKEPILVEQGLHLAATFHPELSSDTRIHRYFVSRCKCAVNVEF